MPFMTLRDFKKELDDILETYSKEVKQDVPIIGVSMELRDNDKYPMGTIFLTCSESLPLKDSTIAKSPFLKEEDSAWQLAIMPKEGTKWM